MGGAITPKRRDMPSACFQSVDAVDCIETCQRHVPTLLRFLGEDLPPCKRQKHRFNPILPYLHLTIYIIGVNGL